MVCSLNLLCLRMCTYAWPMLPLAARIFQLSWWPVVPIGRSLLSWTKLLWPQNAHTDTHWAWLKISDPINHIKCQHVPFLNHTIWENHEYPILYQRTPKKVIPSLRKVLRNSLPEPFSLEGSTKKHTAVGLQGFLTSEFAMILLKCYLCLMFMFSDVVVFWRPLFLDLKNSWSRSPVKASMVKSQVPLATDKDCLVLHHLGASDCDCVPQREMEGWNCPRGLTLRSTFT